MTITRCDRANLHFVRLPTALVVQNDVADPPARLGDWLRDAGLPTRVVSPFAGDALPSSTRGYAAMVVLGGRRSAYDDSDAPWFADLTALLREALREKLPTLGICLGAQLLAQAGGGRVELGPAGPETGPALVAKRDVAASDPLFGPVPFTPDVIQWHYDAITELPPAAVVLASSPKYPNQAFRLGEYAYGLQFHIETSPDVVRAWTAAHAADLDARGIDPHRLLARLDEAHADVEDVWRPFTRRFAELARRYEYDRRGEAAPGHPEP